AYDYLSQAVIPSLPLEVAIVEVTGETGERGERSERSARGEGGGATKQLDNRTIEQSEIASERRSRPNEPLDNWQRLMSVVKPLNHSVEALLRSCAPAELTGKTLTVRPFYPFHKERLEDPRNRKILESAAVQVYGKGVKVKVELAKNEATKSD
ncbi:MAG: hypothetical protein Q8L46_02075, partial [candidate division WWE3 bacterium]|nr:hypothetical protein [candidate division WWE3 bacterium]